MTFSFSAPAQELLSAPGDPVTVTGGFGLMSMRANEFVYSGGETLSQLIWETSYMPFVTLQADVPLEAGWSVSVSGQAGLGGDSYMSDYDWDPDFVTGYGPDDWSDRSLHPDTHVDHYVSGEIALRRRMMTTETGSVSLKGGFKYNDVQWTAYGGSYIYSDAGFRDSSGNFADGAAGATYRQSFPMVFAGAEGETELGQWTLSGGAKAGLTFLAHAEDDHWMRNLRFIDTLSPAPVLAAHGQLDYHFSPTTSAFIAATAEQIFTAVGDVEEVNTNTGASNFISGASGADFGSLSISAGLKGGF